MIVSMSRADTPEGELYLLDKDNNLARLTYNSRHENNPAVSPDGRYVAFNAGDEHEMLTWEIYLLELSTGVETRLTDNNVIDAHPDWHPHEAKLVFSSWRDAAGNPSPTADIHVMNPDGTGQRAVSPSTWEDNDAEWSPDGGTIVFKSTRNTQMPAREEIFLMNADGTGVRRLTTTTGWQSDHDPSWHPDGHAVTFNRYEGARPWTDMTNPDTLPLRWRELVPWNVHAVDLTGNVSRLTDHAEMIGLPTWNADGSALLFLRLDLIVSESILVGAHHRLMLLDPDGGTRQLIPDDRHTPTLEYYGW
ncbi:MAG TPA: hypothetical protein ENN51_01055 [candidate division WOR-3 bacterium]|uniref:Uncharacterized protein n=1 Tax=candidate division WOR-3 bacterium TaxID=2052148 RepID=A0A7V0T436_UNCW3|nr:hypothetical protein [candidate division WOR-3 bacterium]